MNEAGWAGLLTAIHDTVFSCDRETRFALASGDRQLWLTVRAEAVTAEIPAYDAAKLTELDWRAPAPGRDQWFYEVPRTVEHTDWLCRFAVHTASLLIATEPAAFTFHEADDPGPTAFPFPEADDPGPAALAFHEAETDAEPAAFPEAEAKPIAFPEAEADEVEAEPEAAREVEPVAEAAPWAEPVAEAAPWADSETAGADVPPQAPALTVVPDPEPATPTAEEALAALRLVLTEAVAERDLIGYLGALRGAPVCMPLLDDPSPETGVRPAVVRGADNAIFLPIFTSADGLTDFAGIGVPFIAVPFDDLLTDWPEPDWGLIVDPRTDRALTLSAGSLADLRAASPPADAFPKAAAG